MAGEAIEIAAGDTKTFGGEGVDALVAGPFVRPTKITITAWHRGGDKTKSANSAYLKLSLDGGPFASTEDNIFDNYNLNIEKILELPALASVSLAIEFDNVNCRKTHSGLQISVTGI